MSRNIIEEISSLRAAGQLNNAVEKANRSIVSIPADKTLWLLTGVLYCESKNYSTGLRCLTVASRLDGSNIQVWINVALAYRRLDQHVAALEAAKRAWLLAPDNVQVNLAASRYVASKDLDARSAESNSPICERALRVDPCAFEIVYCLAGLRKKCGYLEQAAEYYRKAVSLAPDTAQCLLPFAGVLAELTMFDSARVIYNWVLCLEPDNVDAGYHLSLVQLRQGDFQQGWLNYEHRWHAAVGRHHLKSILGFRASRPDYREGGASKRILLWGEQGVGDEIMFGRLIGEFIPKCQELFVQIDFRLVGLFSRAYPDVKFFSHEDHLTVESYDEQLPLGSLGRILRPTLASFRGKGGGFIAAQTGSADRARDELGLSKKEFLIGLCWRSANPENRVMRSIPLEVLLSGIPDGGQRFVNLQYGDVSAEFASLCPSVRARLLRHPTIDLTADLEGVSSVIEACDLVITVGNTVAHLSGALGKRSWVLLPQVAGWRWMHGSRDSVWYDSTRLFRQQERGNWSDVLSAIRTAFLDEICH